MIYDDDFVAVGGMISKGNRSTRRKPVPVPLCPPQIPHGLARARTRAAAVGGRRPAACARQRPLCSLRQDTVMAINGTGAAGITTTQIGYHSMQRIKLHAINQWLNQFYLSYKHTRFNPDGHQQ
jgi:hypothetical protein